MILLFIGTLVLGGLAFGFQSTRHIVFYDIAFVTAFAGCVAAWVVAMSQKLWSETAGPSEPDAAPRRVSPGAGRSNSRPAKQRPPPTERD